QSARAAPVKPPLCRGRDDIPAVTLPTPVGLIGSSALRRFPRGGAHPTRAPARTRPSRRRRNQRGVAGRDPAGAGTTAEPSREVDFTCQALQRETLHVAQ